MKKNSLKLLSIFFTFPFLMANAPIPQVFTDSYKDFKLSFVSEEETSDGKFKQHFTLENTGKGYISRVYLDDVYSLEFYGSYMNDFHPYFPFVDSVFEPGYNGELVLTSTSKMPDFRKVTPKAEGFSTFAKDLIFEGTKAITLISGSTDDNHFYYQVDLGIKLPDTHYNYGAILKIDYKDVTCYIDVSEGRDYRFETNEELELDKLTILEVIGIKSEPYMTHQLGGCFGNFAEALKTVLIVLAVFFVLLSFGIFSAIFFPAMARRKRRRRAALAEKEKQDEKESQ